MPVKLWKYESPKASASQTLKLRVTKKILRVKLWKCNLPEKIARYLGSAS